MDKTKFKTPEGCSLGEGRHHTIVSFTFWNSTSSHSEDRRKIPLDFQQRERESILKDTGAFFVS